MNNKTMVAVLVLILVALAGVGVGKYAHNYNNEAATLKSQKGIPVADSKVKGGTVVTGGPKGGAGTLACGVNYNFGGAPAAGTLHTGGVVIGTFSVQNGCAYDVSIPQLTTIAISSSVDIRLDVNQSNAYVYDTNSSMLASLNPSLSTFLSTFGQYVWESSTLTIPAGQTHSFEVRAQVSGIPTAGMTLTTQTTNMQAVAPSLGNTPVPITGLTGSPQQIYSF